MTNVNLKIKTAKDYHPLICEQEAGGCLCFEWWLSRGSWPAWDLEPPRSHYPGFEVPWPLGTLWELVGTSWFFLQTRLFSRHGSLASAEESLCGARDSGQWACPWGLPGRQGTFKMVLCRGWDVGSHGDHPESLWLPASGALMPSWVIPPGEKREERGQGYLLGSLKSWTTNALKRYFLTVWRKGNPYTIVWNVTWCIHYGEKEGHCEI